MDQATVSPPGTVALEQPSTVLNPQTVNDVSGGGTPALTEPADTGAGDDGSVESVLETELARLKAEDAKAAKEEKPETKDDGKEKPEAKAKDEKAEKAAKTEDKPQRQRAEDGKFAKVAEKDAEPEQAEQKGAPEEAATGQDGSERGRQSEGHPRVEPPSRFLPKEREAWANVPNVVKSAIDRMAKEHETEVSQFRESHENWQKLSKFDQMAKQHKTTVSDALERYTMFDGLLQSNPIEALRQIMATRGITPEQYANHVLNNPEAHRAPAPQAAPDPVVQQMNSKVETLQAQLEEMRNAQAAATIIEPFRASNPRYDELQDDIAFFLQSGKIPASLTPQQKLEAAYDMAVRINPTSEVVTSQAREAPAAETARPAKLDAGKKSIRGAPDDGADTKVEEPDEDLNALLRKELRRMSA